MAFYLRSVLKSTGFGTRGFATAFPPLTVAITNASIAGPEAIQSIAKGGLLGSFQPINIQIHDDKNAAALVKAIQGSSYPLVQKVTAAKNYEAAFGGANVALAFSKGRSIDAAKDMMTQGQSASTVGGDQLEMVMIGGEAANTSALVFACNAPNLTPSDLCANIPLHGLAVNAVSQVFGCSVDQVDRVIVWGNKFVDFSHTTVKGEWMKGKITNDQAQKLQSALSKPNLASVYGSAAVTDFSKMWNSDSKWLSLGCYGDSTYDIPGLYYGMPVACKGYQFNRIIGIPIDVETSQKMSDEVHELIQELKAVKDFIPQEYVMQLAESEKAVLDIQKKIAKASA